MSLCFELHYFFLCTVISALKKMVVNHIDKTFVTSDAATILKELEVQHPAAKMLQMACKMQ
jgi:T-complex protein 1 subunit theta